MELQTLSNSSQLSLLTISQSLSVYLSTSFCLLKLFSQAFIGNLLYLCNDSANLPPVAILNLPNVAIRLLQTVPLLSRSPKFELIFSLFSLKLLVGFTLFSIGDANKPLEVLLADSHDPPFSLVFNTAQFLVLLRQLISLIILKS